MKQSKKASSKKISPIMLSVATLFAGTNLMALTLDDVAKNIEIDGMLRYRYTDDKVKNFGFKEGAGTKTDAHKRSIAKHQYRAEINMGANIMDMVKAKIGLLYHNFNGKVGANQGNFGDGLGSGADQAFGVSVFNFGLNLAKTNMTFGKMLMQTPYNDIIHDRSVGVLITSKDIDNWILRAGWFDSWSIDDMAIGYDERSAAAAERRRSVNKSYFLLSGSGAWKFDDTQKLSLDIWGTHIKDILNFGLFSQLRYDYDFAHISAIYSLASLNNNSKSALYGIYKASFGETSFYSANSNVSPTNPFEKNGDLFIAEIGARFHKYNVPFALRLGYFGNFMDSYAVSLDNEGYYMYDPVGRLWFEDVATKTTISFMPNTGTATPLHNESNKLNLFFAKPSWDIIDTLSLGLEYVYGQNKLKRTTTPTEKIRFHEITPILTFRPIKPFRITAYYAMLNADSNREPVNEQKNRFRLEVRYNF